MNETAKLQNASYVLAAFALLGVLLFGLLPALLSGLLIYHLVEFGAARMSRIGVLREIGRVVLLIAIAVVTIVAISFGIFALVSNLMAGPESLSVLLHKMADVVAVTRTHLPDWLQEYLPADVEEWQTAASGYLRDNASRLNLVGKAGLILFTNIIFGMIIGGLIALNAGTRKKLKPLAGALEERAHRLADAFRRIVFSQIRISALNTVLTGIFLMIVLPLVGRPLPLAKTLVVLTFVVGLLPVVGNLISNTVIFFVALGVSPGDAIGALVFLVLIHKLEYFMNARIMGSQINARAWELLLVMLVMDAIFGLPGLIVGPIYYAYLKDELTARGMI